MVAQRQGDEPGTQGGAHTQADGMDDIRWAAYIRADNLDAELAELALQRSQAEVRQSETALADGRPRLLTFGVADEDAFAVGLAGAGHCLGMCGPIAFMLPLGQERGPKKILLVTLYQAGRIF